jgi:hypothetical protein
MACLQWDRWTRRLRFLIIDVILRSPGNKKRLSNAIGCLKGVPEKDESTYSNERIEHELAINQLSTSTRLRRKNAQPPLTHKAMPAKPPNGSS